MSANIRIVLLIWSEVSVPFASLTANQLIQIVTSVPSPYCRPLSIDARKERRAVEQNTVTHEGHLLMESGRTFRHILNENEVNRLRQANLISQHAGGYAFIEAILSSQNDAKLTSTLK